MLIVDLDVHVISSGGSGRDQSMFEICVGTDLGGRRLALDRGAEAVGKLYAVVGED